MVTRIKIDRLKKTIIVVAFLTCFLANSNGVVQADPASFTGQPTLEEFSALGPEKISPELKKAMQLLQPDDMITVIVRFEEQANLTTPMIKEEPNRAVRLRNVVNNLQSKADSSQKAARELLRKRQSEGRVSEVSYLWIINGLAVTATTDVIQELATRPEVFQITLNRTIQAPDPPSESNLLGTLSNNEPNLDITNIPMIWGMGHTGQGVVIASLDTGVGFNGFSHPDLWAKWRGGSNSWFDPYGEHPNTPTDVNGHGTWTMGVMIGNKHNNIAFGVAPEAQWIAAKIFKDNDTGTALGIHQAFQWLLDPDGDPDTPDAPHVVNNSWSWFQGCDLEFQLDLQALRAADILPIFAAGNSALTSHSPANYPEAFAVGATDDADIIWPDSSQGPSACDGTIYPEVVAPGVDIHTTSLFNTYFNATGTSLAAPQVTAALALLLSAYPNMTVEDQETALISTVVDRGAIGPDNTYGNGRIDVLAAYQSAIKPIYLPIIIR